MVARPRARAVRELGGLDLLVNCAGEGFAPKPFDELTEDDWDAAFGATAKGSFFGTSAERGNVQTINAKRMAFRYMIFGHNLVGTTSSGCSEPVILTTCP